MIFDWSYRQSETTDVIYTPLAITVLNMNTLHQRMESGVHVTSPSKVAFKYI